MLASGPSFQQLFDLNGQVAIVTGGLRGLGLTIARRLVACDAHLIIADIRDDLAPAVLGELSASTSASVLYAHCDVRDERHIVALIDQASRAFGRLDVLVNNAGIYPYSKAIAMPAEQWDMVLDVDLRGPFIACREAAKLMARTGSRGRIVNVSSMNAFRCPTPGSAHYDAAKAGLNALTRSLAVEFGRYGIRVNAVAPGVTLTDGVREAFAGSGDDEKNAYPPFLRDWIHRMPLQRAADPDEQARVVLFLATEASAYITGQCIVSDGGALLV